MQADLVAAYDATNAPASVSFGTLGGAISLALADAGGAVRVADLSVIPQVALGRTFEFDTIADRYAAGQRTGAPANGVRFVLYAVDPVTEALVFPLVETGYADLTRVVTNPTILVAGFARNGIDSLTFTLASTISLANSTIALDWRTALPTRGLTTRVQQTIRGGQLPQVVLDGLVDETPTILNAQDQPLTATEQAMLRQILEWFEGAFDVYEDLLDPVERLLDIVT